MSASLEGLTDDEIAALAATARTLRDNPRTRLGFLQLAKAANPDLSIPELEAEERRVAAIRSSNERMQAIDGRFAELDSKEAANALYEGLREEGVVKSRSDFNALVKYAAEKGFQTNEAGLRIASGHRAEELRAAEPTPTFLSPATPVALDKDLMKNPIGWASTSAATALNELKANRK